MFCNKRGFTLVELLVSIAIIATLTAILLPNFMGARERARDAQRIQDLDAVKTALRMYYNDKQSYPDSGGAWITDLSSSIISYLPGIINSNIGYGYSGSGDSFFLRVTTEAGNKADNGNSQLKCGVGVGDTNVSYYYVCGK